MGQANLDCNQYYFEGEGEGFKTNSKLAHWYTNPELWGQDGCRWSSGFF